MQTLDNYVALLLDEPHKKSMNMLDQFDAKYNEAVEHRPTVLADFRKHMLKLNGLRQAVDNLKCELSLDVVYGIMLDDLSKEKDVALAAQEEEYAAIDRMIDALREQIIQQNRLHNEQMRTANQQSNIGFEMLEAKRRELETYSDKMFDLCSIYGITTSDIAIDETMFTPEELLKLYDDYLAFMRKEESGSNVIAKFRSKCSNTMTQGVVLLVLLLLCITPLLDIVSIAFFIGLGANQMMQSKKLKYYSILLAITFNIKPENMGYNALDESLLLPEEMSDEDMDNDERFAQFEELYNALDEKYANPEYDAKAAQYINEWSTRKAEFEEKLTEYVRIYRDKVGRIKSDIDAEIAFMEKQYEKLKAEFKFLGNRWSNGLVFNSVFTLGLHDDCIEETIDIGQRNLILRPCEDVELMNKFLQCLYVNAISNVMPGKLTVKVYDPNGFGRSIMPLYTQDLSRYLEFANDGLDEILEELTEYVQSNFKVMSGQTIDVYNKKCEEVGITPIEYKLLIVLSQPKTMEEDEKLVNFFEYSYQGGVFLWVVSPEMQSKNAFVFRRPFESIAHPMCDMITSEWCQKTRSNYAEAITAAAPKALLWQDFINSVIPPEKWWTGDASKFINFYPGYEDGDPNLYKPFTLGNEGNVHAVGVGTSGAGKSVYLNHLIGTMCRLYDPTQLELWMCDFKGSEFVAYMKTPRPKAARLCKPAPAPDDYRPIKQEKLQEVLGYYDYDEETKEYSYSAEPTKVCQSQHIFIQDIKNGKPKEKGGKVIPPRPKADTEYEPNMESYCLPHIAACLCTSDGDFATSLFHAYRVKADDRYADMKPLGVKNMPGWNAKVSGLIGTKKPPAIVEAHKDEIGFNPIWTEADLWTRVLFICDEFQVIFQKADPKNVDLIKADITQIAKVARACGMHIFFTSQSMKGTVSSDILANFTLRFALRCEPEVSQDIIHSTRASDIREKNGYLIVQSQEMKTAEDQKRFKTPFLCDDENSGKETSSELFDNIRMLYNMAKERGFKERDVIAYEEATKHPIQQMIDLYKENENNTSFPKQGLFFLGNRMAYSANRAPDNIIMAARNNENIMSCFNDYNDLVLFFNQIVTNIGCNKNPGSIIINSQIDDLTYITKADEYVTHEKHKRLLGAKENNCASVIKWLRQLVTYRKENNKKEDAIWIILLGWDKGQGFAVEPDMSTPGEMNALLQTCGEVNMHVIFICTSMMGIRIGTVSACRYCIAGKCSLDDSTSLIGTKQASLNYEGMPTGWIFSKHDGVITRDKLYISKIDREIAAGEVRL